MSTVMIEELPTGNKTTVTRRIAEGHALHDGQAGPLVETYWLPGNRAGRVLVQSNRGEPARKALIHLQPNGNPDFYLVAEQTDLLATIRRHSRIQQERIEQPELARQIEVLTRTRPASARPALAETIRSHARTQQAQPVPAPAACPINPLDDECEACQ